MIFVVIPGVDPFTKDEVVVDYEESEKKIKAIISHIKTCCRNNVTRKLALISPFDFARLTDNYRVFHNFCNDLDGFFSAPSSSIYVDMRSFIQLRVGIFHLVQQKGLFVR